MLRDHMLLVWVWLVLPLAWAQFPAVCNTPDSLSTKTCCPNDCGTRGTCVDIREKVENSWNSADQVIVTILRDGPRGAFWPLDVRYQWPLRVFERVCSCHEGWGGYDCSQCDFGFIANAAGECVKRNADQLLVRRNFKTISHQERRDYCRLVKLAKAEENEWAVVDSEPSKANGPFTLQNVTTYDMFVFVHVLTSRERLNQDCINIINPTTRLEYIRIDFAHRGSQFETWHRYFMLLMERELRRIGERVGINNFTLPYFDWTPSASCMIFSEELLGIPEYSDWIMDVRGETFENGQWPVVCDQHYRSSLETTSCDAVRTLCNVTYDRMQGRRLERGSPVTKFKGPFVPDISSIEMAVAANDYATTPFGFATRLEGYVELCAGEAVKCMFKSEDPLDLTFNNLHNFVHIYYGGQVKNLQASVNDPLFFLHHTNVDRILESWLQKFTDGPPPYTPTSGGHPGENLHDYHVPLFPLKTNADMYQFSEELGYRYDGWDWNFPTEDFQIGCGHVREANVCKKAGCLPPLVVGNNCLQCKPWAWTRAPSYE